MASAQVAGIFAAALSDEMMKDWFGTAFSNWLLARLGLAAVVTGLLFTATWWFVLRRPAVRRRATS